MKNQKNFSHEDASKDAEASIFYVTIATSLFRTSCDYGNHCVHVHHLRRSVTMAIKMVRCHDNNHHDNGDSSDHSDENEQTLRASLATGRFLSNSVANNKDHRRRRK